MSPLAAALYDRVNHLRLITLPSGDLERTYEAVTEAMQGTLTVARAFYGDRTETPQVHTLMKAAQKAREDRRAISFSFVEIVWPVVQGTLSAMKADLEAGLVKDIELRAAGEALADMLTLAKDALAQGSDGAKNVAAVLAAAAFEDTVRKLGAQLANVEARIDLSDVLKALKTAQVITGAPFTTAQGYLKFRNDALHADWTKLDRPVVGSCIAFTEGLILKHLS
jgi:hypothetical protein